MRLFTLLFVAVCFLTSCGPKYTYPAEQVPQSIQNIAKKEYKMDLEARVTGTTVGAVLYTDMLVDEKGQIPKEVYEKMGKAMQVITRVALSTDLPLEFCTVSLRDQKSANELVITRSLEDTKRANADVIGVEESINRTLFGQSRYKSEAPEPAAYDLKEIKIEVFLTEQIVQRIRLSFVKDGKDELAQPFVLVDGTYQVKDGERVFDFSLIALKFTSPKEMIMNVFKTATEVLKGYKFQNYDKIEIQDYLNRQKLIVEREMVQQYQDKKIKDEAILEKCLVESQSIQEAFKLFGFTMPQDTNGQETPAPSVVSPA
ncbi:MAG TPA: hypothetical protein VD883_04470 [Candidatus Omnitrophota bacterium]|nr:hypothetical protein [Candidatus Omnitrophota bacterium]